MKGLCHRQVIFLILSTGDSMSKTINDIDTDDINL